MQARTWIAVGSAVLLIAAAGWLATRSPAEDDAAEPYAAAPTLPSSPAELTPDLVRARLFEQGALSGTEPAGDWCVHEAQLRPCLDLRRRFESYILAVGEGEPAEIRKLVVDEARKAHGDKLAAQIAALWDQYWVLRTHEWRHKLDPADLRTWGAAFEEQREVRERLLGPEWAEAFYAEEDRRFNAYREQLHHGPQSGASMPTMKP